MNFGWSRIILWILVLLINGIAHAASDLSGFRMSEVTHSFSPILIAQADTSNGRRAENAAVAVVYPDLAEPFKSIFEQIVKGITERMRGESVFVYPLDNNTTADDLNKKLKANRVRLVIALGRQGIKMVAGFSKEYSIVIGGVIAVPEAEQNAYSAGISLMPDPALLFTHLKKLVPSVKRIFVVYDAQNNEWLIQLARDAARAQGIELVAQNATDLSAAVRIYQDIFNNADGRRDALWLPQDSLTTDENTILPLVLKESWNKNIPLISSNFLHVKKGALLALYPNNVDLGRSLGVQALSLMNGEPRNKTFFPLRDVYTAINIRTANHIGLDLDYQRQRGFDFVFPTQ